ncbi:hypothetical protein [Spirosoma oryzicola]|uniref:hypothetical protein n=1 Tax=Spirosoma oryzicola TaxID=2898794 RepID=UPI001E4326D7|nr:hypothetical protein [Spirosoma oryzicola]UHG92952.1 hypothetical protein LQ777_08625 [Spirosoma oryzicola]
MITVYLDWNIITNLADPSYINNIDIQKKLLYIKDKFETRGKDVAIPYSNAHMNDLSKSYKKGERERVEKSLNYLSLLTWDVCIAKYWGEDVPKWHKRSPKEFFETTISLDDLQSKNFTQLTAGIDELVKTGVFDVFKAIPHDIDFGYIIKNYPALANLYPLSQQENNVYAVLHDTFNILELISDDPSLYNELRKMVKESIGIDPHISALNNIVDKLDEFLPNTLLNTSFTELASSNQSNLYYKKSYQDVIVHKFMQLDFLGYNSDKLSDKNKYSNLFNDALHCYYAAYCDVFITNDKKTAKKSKAVYESEGIITQIYSLDEFTSLLQEINKK